MNRCCARSAGFLTAGFVALALLWTAPAVAQSAPEAEAAAKELIIAMRADQQVKNVFPIIMQQLRPMITQNNPDAARDFDALMPIALGLMNERTVEFVGAIAASYARNFSADELRQVAAFYNSPIGQKLLDKQPALLQESAVISQKFGQGVAADLQKRMTEEMRKRGHN
jgi:hypothetical protein